jgi:predicted transcriptional regulator
VHLVGLSHAAVSCYCRVLEDLITYNSLAIKSYKQLSNIVFTAKFAELLYDLMQRLAYTTLAENVEISEERNICTFRRELKV